jgi:hypothetical protein
LAVEILQHLAQSSFTLNNENEAIDAKSNDTANILPNNILLHELQLGEQLSDSVEQARRADFSLMLAMLAEDVREHSQFVLPKSAAPKAKEFSNQALRKELNLPKQAPLSLKSLQDLPQFNQVKSIIDNDIAHIRLTNAICPKPLSFRDDKNHIPTDVLQNTNVCCQFKHQNIKKTKEEVAPTETNNDTVINGFINPPLSFDAKAWLDGIQQSLVKAPLVN